jgi:hypothetical protein
LVAAYLFAVALFVGTCLNVDCVIARLLLG